MFDIHCDVCGSSYLVGTRSMTAFRNTAEGPVATVRCPRGHIVVHGFHAKATMAPRRHAAHDAA